MVMMGTGNDAGHNVVGVKNIENSKYKTRHGGVGTIYLKQVIPKMETLAAANVSIFRITLVAAANVSKYGNISSCYHPQRWELCHIMYHCQCLVHLLLLARSRNRYVFFLSMMLFFYKPKINLFIVHSAQEGSGEGPQTYSEYCKSY